VEKTSKKWYNYSIKMEGKPPMTQQEELLLLKRLVKKQQEQLAEKDEIIEKQNSQLEKQRIQIENMIQALLHARKKLFGSSTEATKQIEGQLFLFEEVQRLAEELGVEQKKITVKQLRREIEGGRTKNRQDRSGV
jgi:transposase